MKRSEEIRAQYVNQVLEQLDGHPLPLFMLCDRTQMFSIDVLDIITELRLQGYPVIENKSGFYLGTPAEAAEQGKRLIEQAKMIEMAGRLMARRVPGQVSVSL
ncbi:MAG: hypothetical protein IJH11_00325 [Lachnospiraceae bacterium]|nr:hypothetical protein [Lachnospiraceae bacterium]